MAVESESEAEAAAAVRACRSRARTGRRAAGARVDASAIGTAAGRRAALWRPAPSGRCSAANTATRTSGVVCPL